MIRERMVTCSPMARMTKADIIEAVYEKVGGFSKKEAAEIVETVFNVVKETLERGEKIKISGFGNFVVRDKKDRMGRDPARRADPDPGSSGAHVQTQPGPQEHSQRPAARLIDGRSWIE